jgi:hypothetical protein
MATAIRTLFRFALPVSLGLCVAAGAVRAAENGASLGGHFGAVVPMVTRAAGETTTVGDDFQIGFPTGITVKKNGRWAFDLELVPVIQNEPMNVSLTVHPGLIRSLPNSFAAGLRMAFDVRDASWGFTPLLNRGFKRSDHSYFLEVVLPVRFQEDALGDGQTSVGLGVHVGIGF